MAFMLFCREFGNIVNRAFLVLIFGSKNWLVLILHVFATMRTSAITSADRVLVVFQFRANQPEFSQGVGTFPRPGRWGELWSGFGLGLTCSTIAPRLFQTAFAACFSFCQLISFWRLSTSTSRVICSVRVGNGSSWGPSILGKSMSSRRRWKRPTLPSLNGIRADSLKTGPIWMEDCLHLKLCHVTFIYQNSDDKQILSKREEGGSKIIQTFCAMYIYIFLKIQFILYKSKMFSNIIDFSCFFRMFLSCPVLLLSHLFISMTYHIISPLHVKHTITVFSVVAHQAILHWISTLFSWFSRSLLSQADSTSLSLVVESFQIQLLRLPSGVVVSPG